MLSGGKPAAVSFSRNGSLRLFQVGTLRPCLSLPSPVSTMIRRDGVSTSSEWIDIFSRPSAVAKSGISQGSFWISSLVASGRIKRVLPTVSVSTILVILILPTVQLIRRFLNFLLLGRGCWFRPAQCIIRRVKPIQQLSRAIDDDGSHLVAFLHRKMRLRGIRERELRGDVVNARTRLQPL